MDCLFNFMNANILDIHRYDTYAIKTYFEEYGSKIGITEFRVSKIAIIVGTCE